MSIEYLIFQYVLLFFSAIFLMLSVHNFIRLWRKEISDFRFIKNLICSFFAFEEASIVEQPTEEQSILCLIITSLFVLSIVLFYFFERYYLVLHDKYSINKRDSLSLKKMAKDMYHELIGIFIGIISVDLILFFITDKFGWVEAALSIVTILAGKCLGKSFGQMFEVFWIKHLGKVDDKSTISKLV